MQVIQPQYSRADLDMLMALLARLFLLRERAVSGNQDIGGLVCFS